MRYASQEVIEGIVMNRLDERVNGSHGLLYSSRFTSKWLSEVTAGVPGPIDNTFWTALGSEGQRPLVYQIVAPIVAQHHESNPPCTPTTTTAICSSTRLSHTS
ncbi:MAG: hypothetical protein WKF37_02590 [Bryobacteraceae bacterium]